jgi:hypothetical protein
VGRALVPEWMAAYLKRPVPVDLFEAVEDYWGELAPPELTPGSHPAARELVELLVDGVSRAVLLNHFGCQPEQLTSALAALHRGGMPWVLDPLTEVYWVPPSADSVAEAWLHLDACRAKPPHVWRRKASSDYRVPTYEEGIAPLRPRGRQAWLKRMHHDAHYESLLRLYGVEAFYMLPFGLREEFAAHLAALTVPNWCVTKTHELEAAT